MIIPYNVLSLVHWNITCISYTQHYHFQNPCPIETLMLPSKMVSFQKKKFQENNYEPNACWELKCGKKPFFFLFSLNSLNG